MSKRLDRYVPAFFWIGDSGAAIFMAAALAGAVAAVGQGDHRDLALAVGGLIAAALLRAGIQIGAVHAGTLAGRENESQITLYKSLGHVAQDLAAAAYLHARALKESQTA